MSEKLNIYSHQLSRLDRLGKYYERIAVTGNQGWEKVRKSFDNYCRIQQIKFETTIQLLNVDK